MQHVIRILSSYVTTLVTMLIYAAGLAIATLIEKYMGTVAAKLLVYYSPLFFLLQLLMVANFLAIAWQHRLWQRRRWSVLVIHFSFIIILAGALCSHLFSEEGLLHLREGERSNRIAVRTQERTYFHTLPFEVELVKFTIARYPGSESPSSFESEVRVHADGKTERALIYMNNVLDMEGYRFYQASYDPDEKGTVLSVSHDIAGRNITYTGYLLLLVGFLLSFFQKDSRFRQLGRQLNRLHSEGLPLLFLLLGMLFLPTSLRADEPQPEAVSRAIQQFAVSPEHAAAFGSLPMQAESGRMIPVNTFSSEVLRKLHKSEHFGTLDPDQFLLSLLALPEMWMRVPLLPVSNPEIISRYQLPKEGCSYLQLFDPNGAYRLREPVETAYHKQPNQRTRFDKDVMKLDEQINILHQLFSYHLIRIFPNEADSTHRWYAPGDDLSAYSGQDSMFVSRIFGWYVGEVRKAMQTKDWSKADEVLRMIERYQQARNSSLDISPRRIQAEITYNRMNIFRHCKVGYLVVGGLLLIVGLARMFGRRPGGKLLSGGLLTAGLMVFLFHTYGMGVRWYIGGYAPWSNSYETMVYVAWATVLAGGLFVRRSLVTAALAMLFGGIILFVSGLNWMDPQIGTLVPVLKSPWLMFHVAVIVAAYGFFGICCLLGITNLGVMALSRKDNPELTIINEMSLLVGLALMSIGTFLGAVWANESWGRYWGWDPKETWALITMVVYAFVAHLRLVRRWYSAWSFNFLTVLAFGSVLMTFFGVNYLLSGMHSYGENDQVGSLFGYMGIAFLLILLLGGWAYLSIKRVK